MVRIVVKQICCPNSKFGKVKKAIQRLQQAGVNLWLRHVGDTVIFETDDDLNLIDMEKIVDGLIGVLGKD